MKHPALNGWPLFWLISTPLSLAMLVATFASQPIDAPAVSSLIQLSVRCAVPLLYIVFAASSVQVLWPGPYSLWLARNRKYLGLCFAAAMAWQAFFILWLVIAYTDYYVNEVYVLRDAIEGVVGYSFLIAMTVTTFMPVRRRMSPQSWKWLHKIGIYYLWAYAFSVYWWALFYYDSPGALDYVFYWTGLGAWGLRAAAWTKKQRKRTGSTNPLGYVFVGAGLVVAASGVHWYPAARDLIYGYALTRLPELYMPYWPFEPWFAVMLAGIGAYLLSGRLARQ